MQELTPTYAKWRKIILRTNIFMVIFIFIVELIMFLVLNKFDLILQPLPEYFIWFLFIPTIANSIIIIVGSVMIKWISSDSKIINYIPLVQLSAISLVVACIHNIFSITLSTFCFPIFLSAIFGDKKMIRNMVIISYLFITISLFYRKFAIYSPENDIYFSAEAVLAYAFIFATYIIGEVLIKFQEEKTNIINQSYLLRIEMQELLNKDQKTDLYGQTIFANTLNQMVELSESTNEGILLAIIDIDDFKKVNDTYGHLKGDQIILALADTMRSLFQNNHFISRFGGEEFSIIFTKIGMDKAVSLLEGLRSSFEKRKYEFMDEKVTISIGIAEWRKGWTADQLFEASDNAMYISKNSGKNKVIIYQDDLENIG